MKIKKLSDSVERVEAAFNSNYLRFIDGTWIYLSEIDQFESENSKILEEEYQEHIKKDSEKIKIAQDIINAEFYCGFYDEKHSLLEVRKIFGDKFTDELQEKIKDHFRSVL